MELTNIEFKNNSDIQNGGAIHLSSLDLLNLTNCTLRENKANLQGGGLFAEDSQELILDQLKLSGN